MSHRETQKVHELKTWPVPFQAVLDGRKAYEIRKWDRDFQVGDLLELVEFDPQTDHKFSGRIEVREVTYLTPPGKWGLPEDLGVLGLRVPRSWPVAGETWRHFKGTLYRVLAVSVDSADAGRRLVTYRGVAPGSQTWTRPLDEWMGFVNRDAEGPRPRFVLEEAGSGVPSEEICAKSPCPRCGSTSLPKLGAQGAPFCRDCHNAWALETPLSLGEMGRRLEAFSKVIGGNSQDQWTALYQVLNAWREFGRPERDPAPRPAAGEAEAALIRGIRDYLQTFRTLAYNEADWQEKCAMDYRARERLADLINCWEDGTEKHQEPTCPPDCDHRRDSPGCCEK